MASNPEQPSAAAGASGGPAGGHTVTAPTGGTAPPGTVATGAGAEAAARADDPINSQEIHTYTAPWTVYGLGWSNKRSNKFRFAVGSFIEDYVNKVKIVHLSPTDGKFVNKCQFDHPYPPTKIMWAPEGLAEQSDILATTGDYLRLWQLDEFDDEVKLKTLLNTNQGSSYCAPLTSFDWNRFNHNIIGTSSIDTTVAIWDIEAEKVSTQLIAHDKEVYDVGFQNQHTFATVGADGSLRTFDLRALQHSTIMYETPRLVPMLRLQWNYQDPNYIVCAVMDGSKTPVIDVRMPATPCAELDSHSAPANAVAWAPHSACHVCTAGDDHQALIWDLSELPNPVTDPILAYAANGEINQMVWAPANPDWVLIAFDEKMQVLRV